MDFNNFPLLDQLEDILISFISHQAYLAPFILLFIEEAGLPLPVSDFSIAFTGYQVSLGHINFAVAFFSLLLVDLLGASFLYYMCLKHGAYVIEKLGKFIDLDPKKLEAVEKQFKKFGPLFIIFGRHIPGFRIPITVFSGISGMKYLTFLGSTFISVIFWILFYMSVGQRLGHRTVQLFHTHGWALLFFLLPIAIFMAPFFFMRKKSKSS